LGKLAAMVIACRQARCSLSLLLAEWNDVDQLVLTHGAAGFRRLRHLLEAACETIGHPRTACAAHHESGFAVILPDCDRRLGVELANHLIEHVRQLARGELRDQGPPPEISVGLATVALPPKNFPAQDLLEAADRCLYGSRASAGGVVKSIEIY
jgi:GGDEF domain-containing protein